MVERIDKSNRAEDYWKVQSSANTQKDKGQDSSKDEFAGFQEKTDWNLLFDKSKLWKKNIQIRKEEIAQILFQKINLKTDPSLLRVDIRLNGGVEISPAFLAISRVEGLKIKNLNAGDPMDAGLLLKNDSLTVIVPTNPGSFKQMEAGASLRPAASNPDSMDAKRMAGLKLREWGISLQLIDPLNGRIRPEISFVYGISLLILSVLVWGYFLLR